ncbi:snare complex subunit [Grosmannia clavigera kw1407]|uniref:Snare complex subunit n=1 Tax=Grosmannia clavigera (strain kw1407 / UAMH 11150) TaxID=655863 RepID=F0XQC1_GROCL|nr:snare complex subunit [Grosmannia clavigera kw1407]EFX00177.1 snare complex subunit [Grosmannia clavigera kw1407]
MAPPVEISIPTTSTAPASAGTKPYTLYNITLRLPLRSFVVQKRYTDFAMLHSALTDLVGEAAPAPLPGKSWFRRTVDSPELTEERRVSLEAYLRAIAESPDRRWRDTSAWRAFLNLPSVVNGSAGSTASGGNTNGSSLESRLPAIGLTAANAAAAGDPGTWLDLHKEMKKALHDARLQLARRDAAADAVSGSSAAAGSSSYAAIAAGAAAKRELVKAGSLLAALTTGLKTLQEAKRLGDGELRRRAASSNGRGAARAGGRVLGAPLPETDRTRERDNNGVVQLQKQMMAEQDQDVEALARIVQRQRQLGLAIKQEVDTQIGMLTQLDEDTERVSNKVRVAKERTRRLG